MQRCVNQARPARIDPIILEKVIYALHLLEALRVNGLDFVFKGGTSLLLLLEEGNRFSIDIDIIANVEREKLEAILNKVTANSRFTRWQLDERRSYQPGIPKAHYKFFFETSRSGSGSILLDVLRDEPMYPAYVELPIRAPWIETDAETKVVVPTIDAITGDKLTAFAPETIGIPYYKRGQRFSLEICKQLFDLSRLFEQIEDVEVVAKSFKAIAEREIAYRKRDFTPDVVLCDIIDTCVILARRNRQRSEDDQRKFNELQRGIRSLGSFLMTGHFRIEDAIAAAGRIAYLAAKILTNDLTPITLYKGHDISKWDIQDPNWNFLNRLKRLPDKSTFYYWALAVALLSKKDG